MEENKKSLIKDLNRRSEIYENELIGTLIAQPYDIPRARAVVKPTELLQHKRAYEILIDCFDNGKSPVSEFQIANLSHAQFIEFAGFRRIENVAKDVKGVSASWKLACILDDSISGIPLENITGYIAGVQRKLLTEIVLPDTEPSDATSIIKEYRELQQYNKDRFALGARIIGISFGYPKLDEVIDGIRPGHTIILGGYTNLGKSSAMLNIVAALIRQGKRSVIYSLEMTKTDILTKLVGIMVGYNGMDIVKGKPHPEQKVADVLKIIEASGLSIYTTKTEYDDIEFSVYDEITKKPVDFVCVDFIQNITMKSARSEYETLSNVARSFQKTSQRTKVPFMLLSQISNESAKFQDDNVMGFKGSGTIAAVADLAIEIMRSGENKKEFFEKMSLGEPVVMNWNIRKNRHGRKGILEMEFDGKTGIFREHDPLNDLVEEVKQIKERGNDTKPLETDTPRGSNPIEKW